MPCLRFPSSVTGDPQSLPHFETRPFGLSHEGADSFIFRVPFKTNGPWCHSKWLQLEKTCLGVLFWTESTCGLAEQAMPVPQCQASLHESQGKGMMEALPGLPPWAEG